MMSAFPSPAWYPHGPMAMSELRLTPEWRELSIAAFKGTIPLGTLALRLTIWGLTTFALAGCQVRSNSSQKDVFHSKYKKIQMEMTEGDVDQILADYPSSIREAHGLEKELGGSGIETLKRKAFFVKTYDCKLGVKEGDYCIKVYFDENYIVVDKVLSEYVS